jgi:hypothetical protein
MVALQCSIINTQSVAPALADKGAVGVTTGKSPALHVILCAAQPFQIEPSVGTKSWKAGLLTKTPF